MTTSGNPAAVQLACILIKDRFGELCKTVCKTLFEHGRLTLPELRKLTGLVGGDVRAALLVLIQQNCITARTAVPEGGPGALLAAQTLYQIDVLSILAHLRHPAWLQRAHDRFQEGLESQILEVVLGNGRLTLAQITEAVRAREDHAGAEFTEGDVHAAFGRLVKQHLLERCPPADLPLLPVQLHPDAIPKRMSAAKRAALEEADHGPGPTAHRTYYLSRFDLPPELKDPTRRSPGTPDPAEEPKQARKRQKLASGAAARAASEAGPIPLWRACAQGFQRLDRHKVIAEHFRALHGDTGHAIAAVMLDKCPPEGPLSGPRGPTGVPREEALSLAISEPDLVKAARARFRGIEGAPVTELAVRRMIRDVVAAEVELISKSQEGQLRLDLHFALQLLQQREVEAHLTARFGTHGLRVWRLLLHHGQLEEKTVAERAMMHPKEARALLYTLLKAGALQLQDIPKGNDRAASRMFWTWRASVEGARKLLCQHLLHAIANLHMRLQHEIASNDEAVELYRQGRQAALSGAQRAGLQRLRRVQDVCDTHVSRLDALFVLMSDGQQA